MILYLYIVSGLSTNHSTYGEKATEIHVVDLKIPAIEKLADIAASGIGAVGGPMLARWRARAAADSARIEAKGRADALRIEAQGQADSIPLIADAQAKARTTLSDFSIEGELNIKKEIESRLSYQEQKRQNNLQNVVGLAAEELDGKTVDNVDVDHDWAARFFNDVQDVTSEKMQRIWAKILAGEVESPGRTSLHTLSILKNMTQNDAKLFEQLCQFVIANDILNNKEYTNGIPEFPDFDDFLMMESYGLLSNITGIARSVNSASNSHVFFEETMAYRISRIDQDPIKIDFPVIALSPQGSELYRMVPSTMNEDYLTAFAKFLEDKGKFRLERAKIVERLPGGFRCTPWVLVEPRSFRKTE